MGVCGRARGGGWPRPGVLLLMALVAAASSSLRFGERENEVLPVSDSDAYLEMARVFAGEESGFGAPLAGWQHYGRPLLPLLAGVLGRFVFGGDYRSAFSVLNVVAAWVVAVLLYRMLWAGTRGSVGFGDGWVPSLLFLTGFPQLNWGYHVLTDTVGYAAALGAALYVGRVLEWYGEKGGVRVGVRGGAGSCAAGWRWRVVVRLGVLFVLQAVAFLARETAWLVPVVAVVLLVRGGFLRRGPGFAVAVVAVLVLAKAPQLVYLRHYGFGGLEIATSAGALLDPWYLADFVVKSGVAFHVAWVPALAALVRRGWRDVPELGRAWAVAGLGYVAVGYLHNSMAGVGYPLRLSYVFFPAVYALAVRELERWVRPERVPYVLGAFVVVNAAVGVLGVGLDPGTGRITVLDLLGGLGR